MLKRVVAYFLLLALISSNCSRFFVYAGFDANQKYIADALCVNKSKPWLHCNGRCYLMKKLKQAEEKEKKHEREDQKSRYQEALAEQPFTHTFKTPFFKRAYASYLPEKPVQRSSSIFQPPQAA